MASSSEGKVLASLREGNQLRPGPTVCSLCDDDAIAKCHTCGKYLCSDCRVSHKKQRASRDHDVVDIGLLTSTAVQVKCRHHRSSDVKYLCHNCTDVCCDSCITDRHRSHKYSDIDESIDNVKDICQDLAKNLRTPFNTIQGNLGAIKSANESRAQSYKDTKEDILNRKQNLVYLINKIADDEIQSLDKNDLEAEQLYKRTGSRLQECQKNCEKVLAPVMNIVMGHDVHKIITCVQRLQYERESTDQILNDVKSIEQEGAVCLPEIGEGFSMVSDIVRSILTAQKAQESRDRNVSMTTTTRQKKNVAVKENLQPKIGKSKTVQCTQLHFIHKTKLDHFAYISKRVHNAHFLMQKSGDVYLMKYDYEYTELENSLPTTFDRNGTTILTVDESRHIIANADCLNLCDKSGVVRSLTYTDGHVTDVLAYCNSDMFVSLCAEKKQIRYYNTDSLNVINTHPLDKMSDINRYDVLLVTDNHDLFIIATDNNNIFHVTREGISKGAVPVDTELIHFKRRTLCMVKGDQIIAAKNDGSIHWFNLNGGYKKIGQIDQNVQYTWNIGVEDEFLYITYSLYDRSDWIAKFRLSS